MEARRRARGRPTGHLGVAAAEYVAKGGGKAWLPRKSRPADLGPLVSWRRTLGKLRGFVRLLMAY